MLAKMVAWQPPSAGSRPVPIGSRSIGVSLQPAIPRWVAPQQSPLPRHQSPTIVAQSRSSEAIRYAARLSLQRCSSGRARRARRQPRVSPLLCAPGVISILRRHAVATAASIMVNFCDWSGARRICRTTIGPRPAGADLRETRGMAAAWSRSKPLRSPVMMNTSMNQ